jgi:hypothetical protein
MVTDEFKLRRHFDKTVQLRVAAMRGGRLEVRIGDSNMPFVVGFELPRDDEDKDL